MKKKEYDFLNSWPKSRRRKIKLKAKRGKARYLRRSEFRNFLDMMHLHKFFHLF